VRTRMPWRWIGFVVASTMLLTGCRGTLPDGQRWGQDALRIPSWEQVGHAAVDAVLAPETLGTAAGAIIFYGAGNIDRELADWAADHTPLFGSRKRAAQASNYLEGTAVLAWGVTALATPSGEPLTGQWVVAKGEGILTEGLAIGATSGVTTLLKDAVTHRTRPDGSDLTRRGSEFLYFGFLLDFSPPFASRERRPPPAPTAPAPLRRFCHGVFPRSRGAVGKRFGGNGLRC